MDQRAEKYYEISPYAYCAGNPVNAIHPDGRLVIFINGMHFDTFKNTEDMSAYWGGFDKKVMNHIKDWNADYIDGSYGGDRNFPINYSSANRKDVGLNAGKEYARYFLLAYPNKNGSFKGSIKIITHSMGAAYAKGFIEGLI